MPLASMQSQAAPSVLEHSSQYNASYLELFRLTGHRFTDYYDLLKSQSSITDQMAPGLDLLLQHSPHFVRDIGVALFGALALTLFRLFLDRVVIANLIKLELLDKKGGTRFGESLYSLIFYSTSFSLASRIERDNQYLTHPERLWIGFSLTNQIPTLVWILYEVEMSHYFHCLYAVLFINKWSKDSAVLFFHHIVAIILLAISFLAKTYRIGVLVLYLHDLCDVIMEGCKCLIKLQFKNKVLCKLSEIVRTAGFGVFVVFWFLFRLYYFPLRVIYPSVMYLSNTPITEWVPLAFALYFLLWFIFAMNVYWGTLVVKVIINTLRGGADEIDDIREIEEDSSPERKSTKSD